MIIIIRGSDWNHNKAAHTTALLAGCGSIKRTRKSIILQFCNRVPIDNILIGKRLRETDIKEVGFMFEDTGVDALCRRLTKERLQKEVFDSCCTPILNAENLLDVATESKKERFEDELIAHPADIESLIKQTADFYDDVYIFANGKNPAFCEAIEKAIKVENLPSKTFVCIRQGMKEEVSGAEDPCYIVTGYDENSTFDLKYLKNLYKTRKIFNIPYNTEFKDAYNNGALMGFIGKNEHISSDDINYPLFKAIDAILNEFGDQNEEIDDEPDNYENLENETDAKDLEPYREPKVHKETTKKFLSGTVETIVADDTEDYTGDEDLSEEDDEDSVYEDQDDLDESDEELDEEYVEEDIELVGFEDDADEEDEEDPAEDKPETPVKKEKKKISLFSFGKKKDKKPKKSKKQEIEEDLEDEDDEFEDEFGGGDGDFEEDDDFIEEDLDEEPEKEAPKQKRITPKASNPAPAAALSPWKCTECGEDNPGKSKFCVECGAKRPEPVKEEPLVAPSYWTCKFCGEANPAKIRFCLECGSKLPKQTKDAH